MVTGKAAILWGIKNKEEHQQRSYRLRITHSYLWSCVGFEDREIIWEVCCESKE